MGKKLYVGNLGYEVNTSDLEQLFSQHGTVENVTIISDRSTGLSKGFGFVEMGSDDDAESAIRELNGYELEGRTLTVNEARERSQGRGGRFRSGGHRRY